MATMNGGTICLYYSHLILVYIQYTQEKIICSYDTWIISVSVPLTYSVDPCTQRELIFSVNDELL